MPTDVGFCINMSKANMYFKSNYNGTKEEDLDTWLLHYYDILYKKIISLFLHLYLYSIISLHLFTPYHISLTA